MHIASECTCTRASKQTEPIDRELDWIEGEKERETRPKLAGNGDILLDMNQEKQRGKERASG